VNVASAYVEVLDKRSDQALGTLLLTQFFNDQKQLFVSAPPDQYDQLVVDGKPYQFGLRFRREYKPFQVYLEDVQRKDYEVSDRPRDFSSHVIIRDPRDGTELKGHIWMNNPVRYRGETFYQSEYNQQRAADGSVLEMTGLQVVENSGWIIPYVSCMLVLLGMISHFSGTFLRFASRFERGAIPTAEAVTSTGPTRPSLLTWGVIGAVVLGQLAVIGYMARQPQAKENDFDWYAAGQIPLMHEGRIKPLDSVARHVLQTLSEPIFGMTPSVVDETGARRPGTAWLMALMADQAWAADAPVFRVYSQEARDFFGLEPVSNYRYSYNQLKGKSDDLRKHLARATRDGSKLSPTDEKLAGVMRKIQLYDSLYFSYRLPPLPDEGEFGNDAAGRREFTSRLMALLEYEQQIEASNPPAIIPPMDAAPEDETPRKWQAYSPAIFAAFLSTRLGLTRAGPNPAILKYTEIVDAIRGKDPKAFNAAVTQYKSYVEGLEGRRPEVAKARTETWLNVFNPTLIGVAMYLIAFIVALASFLSSSPTVRSTAFAMLLVTLLVHTVAILARIYISGRPPVVNLYSSAVFIGWACVVGALILERIYPLGICNLAAAMIGAATLSVARSLDTSDTMHVLDAVLDTQFWLSTHVITVTLGYGATFLAGMFGVIGLGHRIARGRYLQPGAERDEHSVAFQAIITRMIYGVLCFAILFSFIGTVLGGLWADDSWGRFWGWDPKENGALMIVLWNALVLHANWDRMVGPRGLAVLAVLGNIVTSWSWFGTNQLGIGLHSYGFTSAALVTLTVVVVAHLLFVIFSLVLTRPIKQTVA
jgi:ABC-type transport system involved in cytochrome c biogenesis permease subunit